MLALVVASAFVLSKFSVNWTLFHSVDSTGFSADFCDTFEILAVGLIVTFFFDFGVLVVTIIDGCSGGLGKFLGTSSALPSLA